MNKKTVFFILAIVAAMLVNVFHPYLWGPDEPREAEVAREVYSSGNYVTPHLCGLPFIEKPPLYYDLVAAAYYLAGGASAGAARLVSALLGCLMLAAVFCFAGRWGGTRRGLLALAVLVTMPQFYRAAHWILLDIGVGAFCVLALVIFAFYALWEEQQTKKWPLYLFYFVCALAFLTKGVIGIFHIGIVIAAFIVIRRRWALLGKMLGTFAVLMFILPVALWIYLFYLDGGLYYLHEHFINNIIGRLLHINMKMAGTPLQLTDVGNSSPWYFYIKRLPVMFGAAIAFLPLIIFQALDKLGVLPEKWTVRSDEIAADTPKNIALKVVAFLFNGKNTDADCRSEREKDLNLFLLLWAFLPAILLSFSPLKEVTYILPSYAAVALMTAAWLDERLGKMSDPNSVWGFVAVTVTSALMALVIAPFSVTAYLTVIILFLVTAGIAVVIAVVKLRIEAAILLIFAIILGGIIIGNTPQVMRKTSLNRKCFIDISAYVWKKAGDKKLYIYRGGETLRGSLPFYGNTLTPVICTPEQLKDTLTAPAGNFVIMLEREFTRLDNSGYFKSINKEFEIEKPPFGELKDDYILIAAPMAPQHK